MKEGYIAWADFFNTYTKTGGGYEPRLHTLTLNKQVGQTFSANDFKLNDSMSITVTNTYEKDAEEPIVDPDPTEPATPVGPTKQDDEDQAKAPKTGDNTPMSLAIYGILAAGALLGLRKTTKRETK